MKHLALVLLLTLGCNPSTSAQTNPHEPCEQRFREIEAQIKVHDQTLADFDKTFRAVGEGLKITSTTFANHRKMIVMVYDAIRMLAGLHGVDVKKLGLD